MTKHTGPVKQNPHSRHRHHASGNKLLPKRFALPTPPRSASQSLLQERRLARVSEAASDWQGECQRLLTCDKTPWYLAESLVGYTAGDAAVFNRLRCSWIRLLLSSGGRSGLVSVPGPSRGGCEKGFLAAGHDLGQVPAVVRALPWRSCVFQGGSCLLSRMPRQIIQCISTQSVPDHAG